MSHSLGGVRCLGELVRSLRYRGTLSVYQGDDWKEYIRHNTRLTLFHDESMTLRLVSHATQASHVLPVCEVRLLQGELRLATGERIREGQTRKIADPVAAVSERESVHMEWEL